ncbi:MAG: sigma-54-dependent Fis family transcriptional regulator [Deltaproteobacteria bacterium]|jgi:DNA-binding NtrC family response regulator|nr:sigma-54-dependent Fis family transcriptional regulator [Deltaproteobacteria bacterium]
MTQKENSSDKVLQMKILVVDDEKRICTFLTEILHRAGMHVRVAQSGHEALSFAEPGGFSVAIVDLKMPGLSGIETIQRLKKIDSDMEIIVFTGYPSLDSSLAAIENHVFAYLTKPADRYVIVRMVERAMERRRLIVENRSLVEQLRIERDSLRDEVVAAKRGIERRLEASDSLVGQSEGIRRVRHFVAQVAPTDLAVLILGESGTGKDVVARLIHESSGRDPNAFVKINCPAIPEALLESELFGHEAGAFTGAKKSKPGRFKLASGGTVFLDEIADLPMNLQAKLLQAIEDKCFTPVGSTKTITVDFRIIAATNAPIKKRIAEGRFRADLFYRLDEYALDLPPLRRRKDDIPLLVKHFCRIYSHEFNRPQTEITAETLSLLVRQQWAGNVRELEAFVRRFVLEGSSARALETLNGDSLPETDAFDEVAHAIRETEINAIVGALENTKWNRKKASRLLGMSYSSLRRPIAKYDLEDY